MAVCVRPSVKSVSQSATIVAEMIKSVAARCSHMMSALRGEGGWLKSSVIPNGHSAEYSVLLFGRIFGRILFT